MSHEQSVPFESDTPFNGRADGGIGEVARKSARRLLQAMPETEIESYFNAHAHLPGERGDHTVLRNGHAPQRAIFSTVCLHRVRHPGVDERKTGECTPNNARLRKAKSKDVDS